MSLQLIRISNNFYLLYYIFVFQSYLHILPAVLLLHVEYVITKTRQNERKPIKHHKVQINYTNVFECAIHTPWKDSVLTTCLALSHSNFKASVSEDALKQELKAESRSRNMHSWGNELSVCASFVASPSAKKHQSNHTVCLLRTVVQNQFFFTACSQSTGWCKLSKTWRNSVYSNQNNAVTEIHFAVFPYDWPMSPTHPKSLSTVARKEK